MTLASGRRSRVRLLYASRLVLAFLCQYFTLQLFQPNATVANSWSASILFIEYKDEEISEQELKGRPIAISVLPTGMFVLQGNY